jgi:hypothetical protein
MSEQEHNTVTGPGIGVTVGKPEAPPDQSATTTAPAPGSLEAVKHLLSEKPLRRPNRTRPIEKSRGKKKGRGKT